MKVSLIHLLNPSIFPTPPSSHPRYPHSSILNHLLPISSHFFHFLDSWLHQDSGLLYLACSTLEGRKNWVPAIDHLTEPLPGDYVAIYDTRGSGSPSSRITKIKPENFPGIKGEGQFNLHSIGVEVLDSSSESSSEKPTLRIFLNNHRPFLDSNTGKFLSGKEHGANSTVELFETTLGSDSMKFIRTYSNPLLVTPNMVAPVDGDSFLVTNDHGEKVGLSRTLDLFMPKSHIVYCDKKGCKNASKNKLSYPNGLIKSSQRNVYYQASTGQGIVRSYELQADKSLVLVSGLLKIVDFRSIVGEKAASSKVNYLSFV